MRKIFLALVLLLPALAFGQGSYVPPQTALKSVNGVTVPFAGATITVCAAATGGVPCSPGLVNSIFKDAALTQPLSNPFTADANGNYQFAIAAGTYTVTVSGTGFTGYSYQVSVVASSGSGSSGLSNLVSGQVPIANSATTANSSKAIQGSDANLLSSGAVSGTGSLLCTDSNSGATTTCPSVPATSVPFSGVTAGTNTVPLVEGTGGSISPSGSGQNIGNQLWMAQPIVAPVVTTSGVGQGGSFIQGHSAFVVYTLVSALGESWPSAAVSGAGCGVGGGCLVTVTAPTIPSGYTGYTVYSCDTTGVPCTELKQLASPNCVNITTNCVISTPGAGATFSAIPTAYLQPNGIQASECPAGIVPSIFAPDTSGNYHSWAGVDWNSNNSQTSGTFEICHRTWFTDIGSTPPGGNNAFVVIDHKSGVGTSTANQDRALWFLHTTASGDTTTHYALEGIQGELDILATGAGFGLNGSPDGEASVASFQMGDTAAANWAPSGYGANVIRATYFKNGAGSLSSAANYSVLNAIFQNGNTAYGAGTQANVLNVSCTNGVGGVVTNVACNGYKFALLAAANRYGNGNNAIYIQSGGTPTAGSDFLVRNDVPTYGAYLNSLTTVSGLQMNNVAAFPITGSVTDTGSFAAAAAAAPNNSSSITCSGGASTYNYFFVGIDGNGAAVSGTQQNSQSTCTNPLTSGNPAIFNLSQTFAQQANQAQFVRIDVYRTGGPMGTGKIGSLTCNAGPATTPYCASFTDTGLAGDGGAVPTANTTGGVAAAGYSSLAGNKARVAADFTTAASTNLQTITGLTFNLPPVAKNYNFHCSLSYSQGTANAAVAFGIQSATHAAANIFANGTMQTNATAYSGGTLATLASATATNIMSATPGATASNFTATLDGTIEEPAFDDGNVINIMVSTATSGDAVTVVRGSYCYLY